MPRKLFYHKQIVCGVLLMVLVGCNNQQEAQSSKNHAEKVHYARINTSTVNQAIANNAKEKILGMEEITEAHAVQFNNSLYVAAKPQHHERFQLEKLKKKMKTKLEKVYPNMRIYVSVDKKIGMLIGDLESKIQKKEITEDEVGKKLKKIRSEMNSDT